MLTNSKAQSPTPQIGHQVEISTEAYKDENKEIYLT